MYLLKNVVAKLAQYNEHTCNVFGSSTMKILVESGRMNGEGVMERKYFMQSKKIYRALAHTSKILKHKKKR